MFYLLFLERISFTLYGQCVGRPCALRQAFGATWTGLLPTLAVCVRISEDDIANFFEEIFIKVSFFFANRKTEFGNCENFPL